MKIIVNDKELEVSGKRLLIEELNDAGFDIPSLCYARGFRHEASCMVCMVRNESDNQMIPSCSTYPSTGMRIDTASDEVKALRRMSLELLLSDHRADCEAPCTFVCPAKIDVARLILLYDRGLMAEAKAVLASKVDLSDLPCPTCKAGCEKACRRGRVDQSVSIRDIVKEVAESGVEPSGLTPAADDVQKRTAGFSSKLGVYSKAESEWLKEVYTQPSRCLHCACEGQSKCRLRELATKSGIKSPRYGVSTRLPVKVQQHITGRLYYEPAKCVRCGLCVYNSEDGFTFQNRGFNMQVVVPEESKLHIDEHLAELCPTGALFLKDQPTNQ